jgi:arginine/serine-rich splicing factor 7
MFCRVICGSRVRVELSTGMPRRSRFDRPPARRPFDPNDRCYECGEKGHYAYDCHRYSRRRRSRYLINEGMVGILVNQSNSFISKAETSVFL